VGTGFCQKSCDHKNLDHDDDSKKRHHDLVNPILTFATAIGPVVCKCRNQSTGRRYTSISEFGTADFPGHAADGLETRSAPGHRRGEFQIHHHPALPRGARGTRVWMRTVG
jgi:hypothetical protein